MHTSCRDCLHVFVWCNISIVFTSEWYLKPTFLGYSCLVSSQCDSYTNGVTFHYSCMISKSCVSQVSHVKHLYLNMESNSIHNVVLLKLYILDISVGFQAFFCVRLAQIPDTCSRDYYSPFKCKRPKPSTSTNIY